MQRWIDLDGVANMRDVGGLPTHDGGRIMERRLIRSDNLQDLSPSDVRHLTELIGVTDIVDLRSHKELRATGSGPLRATPLRHHHHSFLPEPVAGTDEPDFLSKQTPAMEVVRDADYWSQHYRGYLSTRPDSVSAALAVVATASGATVVHCAAGKDRTGTVVGLALSVAGVPDEEIVADYTLTAQRLRRVMDRLFSSDLYRDSLAHRPFQDQIPAAASMISLLEVVDQEFGGAAGWLRTQGWSADEVATLRTKLRT